MMETNLGYAVLYTAVFLIYSSMEVLGIMPQELRSAGITLPSLLSRWFGDQVSFLIIAQPSVLTVAKARTESTMFTLDIWKLVGH